MNPSPQGPAASFVDRRRSPRIEAAGRVSAVWLSGSVPVEVYDVCANGFSVLSDVGLAVNAQHRFTLRPLAGSPGFDVLARVRYCRPFTGADRSVRYLSGLAFIGLDEAGRRNVDRLIDSLTATLSFD